MTTINLPGWFLESMGDGTLARLEVVAWRRDGSVDARVDEETARMWRRSMRRRA